MSKKSKSKKRTKELRVANEQNRSYFITKAKNKLKMSTEVTYVLSGVRGFTKDEFYRGMKTRFEEYAVFLRNNKNMMEYDRVGRFKDLPDVWDQIKPFECADAMTELNQEKRRAMFSLIGPSRMFQAMNPKLLDKQTIKKKLVNWDDKLKEEKTTIEDVYELYSINTSDLFKGTDNERRWGSTEVYAVRCWCTSTNREYWIMVPGEAAGLSRWSSTRETKPDAIKAIAWTFRVGYKKEDIDSMYRQGDCLIIKPKKDAQRLPVNQWYHMDKETYLSKLIFES